MPTARGASVGARRPAAARTALAALAFLLPVVSPTLAGAGAASAESDPGDPGGAEAGEPVEATSPEAPPYLYVANQGDATISVVEIGSWEPVRTIHLRELGYSAGAKPHDVAVAPDGSRFHVSLIGENRVVAFRRNGERIGEVAFEVPGMLAIHPSGSALHVGRSMSAVNPPRRIGSIAPGEMTIAEIGVFFPRPHAIAANPRTGDVYTASLAENRMAVVDVAREEVELVGVAGPPHAFVQFAVSPDGRTLVGSAQLTGQLLFFDVDAGAAPERIGAVRVGNQPWHPSFHPSGERVYVGVKEDDAVAVVDARAHRVEALIEGRGLAEPHGSAVSPDGRWVFISNQNTRGGYRPEGPGAEGPYPGTVVVIDAASGEIARVLEVGVKPAGIGTRTAPGGGDR